MQSFEQTKTFSYKGEGWGLTHDDTRLILSDGTPQLRFIDPATLKETGRITVRDAAGPVEHLNELEYVKGEIFANIWQTDRIARISPKDGRVTGWIDLVGPAPGVAARRRRRPERYRLRRGRRSPVRHRQALAEGVRDQAGQAVTRASRIETERGHISWIEGGAGWPVVLLHGFPLSADMWRAQVANPPEGWRLIAPDLRGFGQSGATPGSPVNAVSMDDYAADVLAFMDSLKLDEAVIGGLSMGGYITFAMHRLEPDRFSGMVLADTRSGADTPQAREGRVRLREVLAKDGPRGVADEVLPKQLGEKTRAEKPDCVKEARALIESATPEAIDAAIVALMGRPDSTPGLSAIGCATLVVVGEQDEITPPAESEAMQRAIPRSTLCVIPGAGHLSCLEQPEAFSRALADFLPGRL